MPTQFGHIPAASHSHNLEKNFLCIVAALECVLCKNVSFAGNVLFAKKKLLNYLPRNKMTHFSSQPVKFAFYATSGC